MIYGKLEFLSRAGLRDDTLSAWIDEGWLIPESVAEMKFSEIDVARAGMIRVIQVDLGVNAEGVAVILNLVDQLHGMRRKLQELRLAGSDVS